MNILSVGAGMVRTEGAVHLDRVDLPGIEIVWDLEKVPYPLGGGCWDVVLAKDILEHLDNVVECVDELNRVLKVGGRLVIRTSYWKSEASFRDPTHKRFCTEQTFDYWCPETPTGAMFWWYTKTIFRKVAVRLDADSLWVEMEKVGEKGEKWRAEHAGRIFTDQAVVAEGASEMERGKGGRGGGEDVEQGGQGHGPDGGSGKKVADV